MLEEEEEMTVTKDKLKAQSFIRLAVAQLRTTASLRMEPEGGVFFRWWREAFYCQNSLAEYLSPTASLNAPPTPAITTAAQVP